MEGTISDVAHFAKEIILTGGESAPFIGPIVKTIGLILEVSEKKKSADDNMAEVSKVVANVMSTVDSLWRRKTGLDTAIRTNLSDLGDVLDKVETATRKYAKKGWFSKTMSGKKYEEKFENLLEKIKTIVSTLNFALSADTHQMVSNNAATLGRVEDRQQQIVEGQKNIAAKKDHKDYEEHEAVTVLQEAEIPKSDIKNLEGKPFAEGGFGKVFRGDYAGTKTAVKRFDLTGLPESERTGIRVDFVKELQIMRKLRHPCIVAVLGACTSDGNTLALVMELVDRGDLTGILNKEGGSLTMKMRYSILNDVAMGMGYLYSLPIPVMHRDLKSLNVLITTNWRAKVSDFGLAKKDTTNLFSNASANSSRGRGLGTARWKAPEQFGRKKPPFNERSDVYSYGIVIWETLTGKIPYEELANDEISLCVVQGERPSPMPERLDEQIVALMVRCWEQKNEERPSFEEIKEVTKKFGGVVVERPRSGTIERERKELEEQKASFQKEQQKEQERRKASDARKEKEMKELREKYEAAEKAKEEAERKAEEAERKANIPPNPPPRKSAADEGKGGAAASGFKFTSNEQLKEAVGEWAGDKSKAKEKYGHISDWDVSEVTSMERLFSADSNNGGDERMEEFNEDLSRWNTGKVENMYMMFSLASSFNSDLSGWDVSKVEDMMGTFIGASSFNSDLAGWDVSKVEDMEYMFNCASSIYSDLTGWDTSKCKGKMSCMFDRASSMPQNFKPKGAITDEEWQELHGKKGGATASGFKFTSNKQLKEAVGEWAGDKSKAEEKYGHISDWDVSEVTSMERLFSANSDDGGDERMKDFNEDLSRWKTGKVTTMKEMFSLASSFNSDLSGWDVSKVENMYGLFAGASSFNCALSGWDVGKVENMTRVFNGASSFNSDLSGWDVRKVEDMTWMFHGASSFNSELSGWDVSKVENMGGMFYKASSFDSDLSGWDVSKVVTMAVMFYGASSFNSDLSGWDVSKVEKMVSMFSGATSFNSNLTGWDTSKCQGKMDYMFWNASSMPQNFKPKGAK